MNMIGLPATPRGNSMSFKIFIKNYGDDLTGTEFAFIASRGLSGHHHHHFHSQPRVHISWMYEGYDIIYPPPIDDDDALTQFPPHYTFLIIPSYITAPLESGGYFFNIDMKFANPGIRTGTGTITPTPAYIKTILAGTWSILPVPGLMSSFCPPGFHWNSPGWQPQLMDQFPPRLPRRSYAY